MKSMIFLLLLVIVVAVAAGIIVIKHQGTKPCVSYYSKTGSHALYKDCK
jgi:hypothetical protein